MTHRPDQLRIRAKKRPQRPTPFGLEIVHTPPQVDPPRRLTMAQRRGTAGSFEKIAGGLEAAARAPERMAELVPPSP
ncbi:hypothetical protein K1T35_11220 [Pseudonocardia sp. DSM 110487]|uniref:hypothetical protein n=1 Tax=Pseudonocardia sp. DSM 110487 TaxID=2865833 RepID=UPI001C69CDBC|nr:hypothetical protein [Pseudonocardia sp. DSM 110487]QYN37754.1 hypothetical protein K1T35_11220 [Pseudonocardia sp. DSM 110487]